MLNVLEMTFYNTDRRFKPDEYVIKPIWRSTLQVTLLRAR